MSVYLPKTLREATDILRDNPGATLLGGGTDVMVEVNFNHRKPETVIALRHISELFQWSLDSENQRISIGALVPYRMIETGALAEYVPALAQAARTVGSPQIRAAGSLGGNLGTCSPAGDSLPVLSALDASIHVASSTGTRQISFHDFMIGPKRNALSPDEIITSVSMPLQRGRQGYAKVGVRNAMVISVASACFAYQDNTVRLALGSVGPTIIRCTKAENFANGLINEMGFLSENDARQFGAIASEESRPIDDHRSTAVYRRHAIGVLAQRLALRGNNV